MSQQAPEMAKPCNARSRPHLHCSVTCCTKKAKQQVHAGTRMLRCRQRWPARRPARPGSRPHATASVAAVSAIREQTWTESDVLVPFNSHRRGRKRLVQCVQRGLGTPCCSSGASHLSNPGQSDGLLKLPSRMYEGCAVLRTLTLTGDDSNSEGGWRVRTHVCASQSSSCEPPPQQQQHYIDDVVPCTARLLCALHGGYHFLVSEALGAHNGHD
jgi:hypothetical protein